MAATKVVSFRIPLSDYAELLKNATAANMNIADYMIFIIYSDRATVLEASQRVIELSAALEEHAQNQEVLRDELSKKNEDLNEYKKAYLALIKKVKDQAKEHNDFVQEMEDLMEEVQNKAVFSDYTKILKGIKKQFWR